MVQCGKGAVCPICSAKLSERRAQEMRIALNSALNQGYQVSLVTFTAPHTADDEISSLIGRLTKARRFFFKQDKGFKKFIDDFGLIGRINSFEVTFGNEVICAELLIVPDGSFVATCAEDDTTLVLLLTNSIQLPACA